MNRKLTPTEAFYAMTLFLDIFYLETHSDDVGLLLSEMQVLKDGDTADPAAWYNWEKFCNQVLKEEQATDKELTPLQAFKVMRYFLDKFRDETNSEDVQMILNTLLPMEHNKPTCADVWKDWEKCISQAFHEQCSSLCGCLEESKERR